MKTAHFQKRFKKTSQTAGYYTSISRIAQKKLYIHQFVRQDHLFEIQSLTVGISKF
jgi:hypothetical protein